MSNQSKVIPKSELKDGVYYLGSCRNSDVAVWDETHQLFWYMRTKFGDTFHENIRHPEDDDGFDLFIPVTVVDNPDPSRIVDLDLAKREERDYQEKCKKYRESQKK
jgi:Rad3-related DNA helicase